ncbi:MAG: sugar-binding protein [Lentisphaeria bacterium]
MRKMLLRPCLILFFIVFLGRLTAGTLIAPLCSRAPQIDGVGEDSCWTSQPWQSGFTVLGDPKRPAVPDTAFKVTHDGRNLYLLIRCAEPKMASLVAATAPEVDAPRRWKDDSLEISLVPHSHLRYYKLMVNANGFYSDETPIDNNTGAFVYYHDWSWSSFAEVKASRAADSWTVELRIPFFSMDLQEATGAWGFNIGRNRYADPDIKKESSSWSPIPEVNHCLPTHFRSLELEKVDLARYRWELNVPDGTVRRDGESFLYDLAPSVRNFTGDFRLGVMSGWLLPPQGGGELASPADGPVVEFKSGIMLKTPVSIPFAKPGEYLLRLLFSGQDGVPLKLAETRVHLDYTPVKITIETPVYRNNIYATMPDKTLRASIEIDQVVHKVEQIEACLTGPKGNVHRVSLPLEQGIARFTYDMAKLPDGDYYLEVLKQRVRIRKLPYQKGEVWCDKNDAVFVDGKPFVLFGWTHGKEVCAPGITGAKTYDQFADSDNCLKDMNQLLERNPAMKLVLIPYSEKNRYPQVIFSEESRRGDSLTPKQIEHLTRHITKIRSHPAVLAYDLGDEPECRDNNPEWYRKVRELLTELDPYHPCVMLNQDFSAIRKYACGGDINMPDCYPHFYEPDKSIRPLHTISAYAREARKTGPAWLMPQAFCWPTGASDKIGRAPTFTELRNQVYQVFANDCKGVLLYSLYTYLCQQYEQLRLGPEFIARELLLLTDFIAAPPAPGLTVSAEGLEGANFQSCLKRVGDRVAIFAVNTAKSSFKVRFAASNLPATLHILSEERTVAVADGVFEDTFAPEEARVYLSDPIPAGFETLAHFQKRLAEAEARRFTPGNLLATGPVSGQVYIQIARGQALPQNWTKLTASSETTSWYNRHTKTLYFLVDGLRPTSESASYDIHRNGWTPARDDKQPWLQLDLPRPAVIRELRLYNVMYYGCPRLENAEFQLQQDDGTWKTLAAVRWNREPVVILQLPDGTRGQTFRLLLTSLRTGGKHDAVLSEIELIGEFATEGK